MSKEVKLSLRNEITAVTSERIIGVEYVEKGESVSDRMNKWFIRPLREMKDSQGYIVLMVLLPLYEKHLRVMNNLNDKERFSKGHPIFKTIGKQLKLSESDSYLFWKNVRNGLLHKALPAESDGFKYCLRAQGPPIEIENSVFCINPFALRDSLLPEIEADTKSWKIDDVPLAKTFIQV